MLEWEKPQEHPELADAYTILRTDLPDEAQTITETRYEDVQYRPGKVLTYQVAPVRRVDGKTISGVGPESVTVTVEDKTAPKSPAGLEIVQSDTGGYLTWAPNSETDLAGYRVFRSDRANGEYLSVSERLITTNAFFDPAYRPGQYYRVSAVDEFGNESAMSAPFVGH
jgi:fibronectin type 3 domain-containing protein